MQRLYICSATSVVGAFICVALICLWGDVAVQRLYLCSATSLLIQCNVFTYALDSSLLFYCLSCALLIMAKTNGRSVPVSLQNISTGIERVFSRLCFFRMSFSLIWASLKEMPNKSAASLECTTIFFIAIFVFVCVSLLVRFFYLWVFFLT